MNLLSIVPTETATESIRRPAANEVAIPIYEGFRTVALRAASRNQRVLPIIVGAKNPAIKWKGTEVDTASSQEWWEIFPAWIEKYAGQFPEAAVAVIAKPDEYLFIDEDESERFRKGYEVFSSEAFPNTFTTESRPNHRQSHWLQTAATRKLGNVSQGDLGFLSVRQNNLYVLSEGSPHPKGGFYRIVDDTPAIPMPDKLVEWILHLKSQHKAERGKTELAPTASDAPIQDGGRNTGLTSLGGTMRHACLEYPEIEAALLRLNRERCQPPLDEDEVRTIAASVSQYALPVVNPVLIGGVPVGRSQSANGDQNERIITDPVEAAEFMKSHAEATAAQATAADSGVISQEMIDENFPAYDGKPPKTPRMLIDGFLMGGVNFFGSLSGVGKSWVALAVAKALTTGESLFGAFPITQTVPCLYLIPESDEAGFKYRLGVIGMTQSPELFRYRTISQGSTLSLVNDLTLAAIKYLHHDGKYPHVLVIVDTAVRFMVSGSDMKSATNNTLSNDAEILRSPEVGADVLFLHHSPKTSSKGDMTLENVLRDTGDLGAMADCVFGLRRDEQLFDYGDGPEELDVINVKMRAPERPKPFRLRLKRKPEDGEGDRPISVVQETGTLGYVGQGETAGLLGERLSKIIGGNPKVSLRALKDELKIGHDKIKQLAESRGWKQRVYTVPDPKTGKVGRQFMWSQVVFAGDKKPEDEISFDGKAA